MSDTTGASSPANISSASPAPTGGAEVSPKKVVNIAEYRTTSGVAVSQDVMEPEKLYGYFSHETGRIEIDAPLGLIGRSLGALSIGCVRPRANPTNCSARTTSLLLGHTFTN
jgi:hypothetical protein